MYIAELLLSWNHLRLLTMKQFRSKLLYILTNFRVGFAYEENLTIKQNDYTLLLGRFVNPILKQINKVNVRLIV